MIYSYLIGIAVIVLIMLAWVWIQARWRETFADEITEEDVLAERRSCGNCGCGTVCKLKDSPSVEGVTIK